MSFKKNVYLLVQILVFCLSLFTGWYSVLTIVLFVTIAVMMLDRLGKGIVLRELIAMHTCFVCLVIPLVGYNIFDNNKQLVRLWVKEMPVAYDTYFTYVLPAVCGFILALCWPISKSRGKDEGVFLDTVLSNAKVIINKRPLLGVYLMCAGVLMHSVSNFLPEAFRFVALLFYFSSFAGFLYVFYSPHFKYRIITLTLFVMFILGNALRTGMFTEVAYMGLTLFSFFFLGKKTLLWKKMAWFIAGAYLLLLLQAVKPLYRQMTWKHEYEDSKGLLFAKLLQDQVLDPKWQSFDALFPIYVRTNQGFNVALTMRRIPDYQEFDNGERLFLSLASALVPRLLWPDKPEAGGKFNIRYYTGYTIVGWSTNVGPLGEAYGSFGVVGGVIFMVILGSFVRWSYSLALLRTRRSPLLIFWIPVLFYQVTYSAETDTLQILNSLLKTAFFIWLLHVIFPKFFPKLVNGRNANFPKARPSVL